MSSDRYHNLYVDGAASFWTSAVVDRIPIFKSRTASLKLLEIWDTYRRRYETKLLGYVIMPDHIHMIVWAKDSELSNLFFEQTLRRSSSALVEMTAKAAARDDKLASIWFDIFRQRAKKGCNARFWKERGRALPITDDEMFLQKMEYMHSNPVKAGFVVRPEDWEFSSARWFTERQGPIELDMLEL